MRKLIREIIKESIMYETREFKKQFLQDAEKAGIDFNKFYYVHWIPDTNPAEVVSYINNVLKTGQEISCNILNPKGAGVTPHEGSWGPVGIVVQGIVTYGDRFDVNSSFRKTPSGYRKIGVEGDLMRELEKSNLSFEDYMQSGSFYFSDNEFFVVPKKVLGVCLFTPTALPSTYVRATFWDPDITPNMKEQRGPDGFYDGTYVFDKSLDLIATTKGIKIAHGLNTSIYINEKEIDSFVKKLYKEQP